VIDTFDPYEGAYCMKSGAINDDQESVVSITMDVLLESEISFYRAVSSESGYDYLRFYIDGVQQAQWAGEEGWGLSEFPVSPGERTFTWAYEKDYSVSNGLDCGFVDFIIFPPSGELNMAVSAGPDISICEDENAVPNAFVVNAQSMLWASEGDGTFDDPTILNPVYTPGEEDINLGIIELSITAWDAQGDSQTDETTLYIYHMPIVDAGEDMEYCADIGSFGLSGVAINTDDFFWFTTGDGTFSNENALETTYYPGDDDIASGGVEISLNANAQAPCDGLVNEEIHVELIPLPEVMFDELPLLGLNSPPYELTEGSPAGGEYSGPGVTDGWLYPELAGVGVHTLTYTYEDEYGCENYAEQEVTIDEFVGINDLNSADIKIIPNPSQGIFKVFTDQSLGNEITATIYNASGEVILMKDFKASGAELIMEMNFTGQPAGVYYLHLQGSQKVTTRKIVIR
jgi:hypothetical protein